MSREARPAASADRPLTVGSLFAGIGGFDLGFERAGFEIKWQVEIDPFCRRVLEKHWPHVRRYEDVREIHAQGRACPFGYLRCEHCLDAGDEVVDVLCGGFPCQDISVAGRGGGLSGRRSGLWFEFARLIREIRPNYVVVENVPALLGRGMGTVLGDLAALGYDAEWECLSAASFGARHLRERVWIVAYPHREGSQERQVFAGIQGIPGRDDDGKNLTLGCRWVTESPVVRAFHGIPHRMDRIRSLGNAIVPQIAQWIAERIKEAEGLSA